MQNWNTLLKYIKRKVGAPLTLLEYSDNDIYDIVKEDVLPRISSHIGKPIFLEVKSTDKLEEGVNEESNQIFPIAYRIPIPDDIVLVEVFNVYYSREQWGIIGTFRELIGVIDPRNIAISNTFIDMLESLDTVQTFRFIPPDKIYFDEQCIQIDNRYYLKEVKPSGKIIVSR